MRRHKEEVPCAPIRRHLQEWMDRHDYDANTEAAKRSGELMSPLRIAIETLWPDTDWTHHTRSLWAILYERDTIGFDLADRIVCQVLERPWLWQSDPEMADAYKRVDFRSLDATRPTCAKVEQATSRKVVASFKKTQSIAGTAKKTGIAWGRVQAILKAAT